MFETMKANSFQIKKSTERIGVHTYVESYNCYLRQKLRLDTDNPLKHL